MTVRELLNEKNWGDYQVIVKGKKYIIPLTNSKIKKDEKDIGEKKVIYFIIHDHERKVEIFV